MTTAAPMSLPLDVPTGARMTARQVRDALRRRHGCGGDVYTGEWVCITEAFSGWVGGGKGVDLLAVGAWASAKVPGLPGCGNRRGIDTTYPVVAYEVKISRSDFARELYGKRGRPYWDWSGGDPVRRPGEEGVGAWPEKARLALARAHYFMFAVPAGLLTDGEIARREPWEGPRGRGLYVPAEAGLVEVTKRGCRVRVPAVATAAVDLSRGMVHELIRTAVRGRP